MYDLNCVIVIVFNCTNAYAWGNILIYISIYIIIGEAERNSN